MMMNERLCVAIYYEGKTPRWVRTGCRRRRARAAAGGAMPGGRVARGPLRDASVRGERGRGEGDERGDRGAARGELPARGGKLLSESVPVGIEKNRCYNSVTTPTRSAFRETKSPVSPFLDVTQNVTRFEPRRGLDRSQIFGRAALRSESRARRHEQGKRRGLRPPHHHLLTRGAAVPSRCVAPRTRVAATLKPTPRPIIPSLFTPARIARLTGDPVPFPPIRVRVQGDQVGRRDVHWRAG